MGGSENINVFIIIFLNNFICVHYIIQYLLL